MGKYAAGDAPEADRIVGEAVKGIGSEIESLKTPRLAGVVLGGGYGRGEGGVRAKEEGSGMREEGLSNDLDFFAITEKGATGADIAAISASLEPVSKKWTQRLGIDVDFTVKTPWRLRHDQERLMVQELVHGYFDVAGAGGKEMFAGIERRDPAALPWMEAARLLMNRGVGLLLALSGGDRAFAARNLNKCVLGAGDAVLVAHGQYRWRATDRAEACTARDWGGLYARAVEWKFRPREEPVCDWDTARERWLDAKRDVEDAADGRGYRRSLRGAARWIVRRRTFGEAATFGQDPVVRIMERVARCIEARTALPQDLRRDWEIFN